jgi:hypothetical protein
MMRKPKPPRLLRLRYLILLLSFLFLLINHVSIVLGVPWLIPSFLRIQ